MSGLVTSMMNSDIILKFQLGLDVMYSKKVVKRILTTYTH